MCRCTWRRSRKPPGSTPIATFPQGKATVGELQELMHRGDALPSATISARWSSATYHCATGYLEESRRSAEAGLALTERTGVHSWDYPCRFWSAVASLHMGDLDKAGTTHRQTLANPAARGGFGAQYHQQLAVWEAVQNGEYAQALVHA